MRNPKNNRKYNLEFQIVSKESKPVLGASAIQGMELITVNMQNILTVDGFTGGETQGLAVSQVVSQFKDVFEGEGMLMGKLHLQVDQCVPPVQLPARKPPVALKEKYQEAHGEIHLCLDLRSLNKALKRNHYPMPVINDLLPKLCEARVFSVVDVKHSFWHVQLDDESSKLTTLATPWGRFRWLKIPFGIAPSPEEFQRRLNEALEGLDGVRTIAS